MEIPEEIVESTAAKLKVYREAINLIWEITCTMGNPDDLDEATNRLNYIAGVADLAKAIVGENKNEISG